MAGGRIFYDKGSYSDGWRYLEAAPAGTYDSAGVGWAPSGRTTEQVGTTAVEIGAGLSNSQTIYTALSDPTYSFAAKVCEELYLNGYDDWFLPSKDELNLMWQNRAVIGGFWTTAAYWNSSENTAGTAWYQFFNEAGTQEANYDKGYGNRVRPIRRF